MFTRFIRGDCRAHLGLAFAFTCLALPRLQAAPVTFEFSATVGQLRSGVADTLPPNLGAVLNPGDVITGQMTFEPQDVPGEVRRTTAVELHTFALVIRTHRFETSQYLLNVFDNSVSDDDPTPQDVVTLSSPLVETATTTGRLMMSSDLPLALSFAVSLRGPASALQGADVSPDPAAWNQLLMEDSLFVIWSGESGQPSYGFRATITNFSLVPEPATSSGAALFASLLYFRRYPIRRYSRRRFLKSSHGAVNAAT
jgi:hypothetical protein